MTGKRPTLRHFYVCGCRAQVRPYNLETKKLNLRTVSGFFVGCYIRSRGSRFYCPTHTTRIIESDRAVYLEGESEQVATQEPRAVGFREERVVLPTAITSASGSVPSVLDLNNPTNPAIGADVDQHIGDDVQNPDIAVSPPRRSERVPVSTESTRFRDYVVYLQEHEFTSIEDSDPITFQEAVSSPHSSQWLAAMQDELASMRRNNVWDLVELPADCETVGCKWVFKTKRDAKGEIERYKVRLVAKGYN